MPSLNGITPSMLRCVAWWQDKMLDVLDCFFSFGMKVLGPCLGALAVILICLVVYSYFGEVVFTNVVDFGYRNTILIDVFGLGLTFGILFNHQSAHWTSPGYCPKASEASEAYNDHSKRMFRRDPELKPGDSIRWCNTCQVTRAWRAHHDPVTNRCVLKMDHYCPWVNNCVGYGNYRYFLSFLLYLWAGTGYFLGISYSHFHLPRGRRGELFNFTYILCIGINIAMCLFLFMHFYLAMTNQSTIEVFGMPKKRKFQELSKVRYLYSIGIWGNLQEIFGYDTPWYLWLMPSRRKPPGNGHTYPVSKQVSEIIESPEAVGLRSLENV